MTARLWTGPHVGIESERSYGQNFFDGRVAQIAAIPFTTQENEDPFGEPAFGFGAFLISQPFNQPSRPPNAGFDKADT